MYTLFESDVWENISDVNRAANLRAEANQFNNLVPRVSHLTALARQWLCKKFQKYDCIL